MQTKKAKDDLLRKPGFKYKNAIGDYLPNYRIYGTRQNAKISSKTPKILTMLRCILVRNGLKYGRPEGEL
jgi:hypothetical protein